MRVSFHNFLCLKLLVTFFGYAYPKHCFPVRSNERGSGSEWWIFGSVLQNGTWYHLSVHAAPHFVHVPKEIYYVNIGDSIILNCQVYKNAM